MLRGAWQGSRLRRAAHGAAQELSFCAGVVVAAHLAAPGAPWLHRRGSSLLQGAGRGRLLGLRSCRARRAGHGEAGCGRGSQNRRRARRRQGCRSWDEGSGRRSGDSGLGHGLRAVRRGPVGWAVRRRAGGCRLGRGASCQLSEHLCQRAKSTKHVSTAAGCAG
jgi:hypothetical protein